MQEKVICVCTQCQALCFVSKESFMDSYDVEPNPKDEAGHFSDISKVKYMHYIKKLTLVNSKTSIPPFPLCQKCTELAIEHSQKDFDLTNGFLKVNSKYNTDTGRALREKMNRPYIVNTDGLNITVGSRRRHRQSSHGKEKEKKYQPLPLFPFTSMYFAFKISQVDFFGTINGLRVGTLDSIPVSHDEINHGLFLITRVLIELLKVVKFPTCAVSFAAGIPLIDIQSKRMKFKFPTSKSEISDFNIVLNKIMNMFELVFQMLSKKGLSPPHLIKSETAEINDHQYLYNSHKKYEFTLSMRMLLIDIKTVLVMRSIMNVK